MSAILRGIKNFKAKTIQKLIKPKKNGSCESSTTDFPIALQWIISEECLQSLRNKPCEFYESEIFDGLDGFKYSLTIYPNGDGKTKIGQTRIFFRIYLQAALKIEAEFRISIESAKYLKKLNYTFEKSKGWGIKCCSTEKFFDPKRKYIVNGFLNIQVHGVLKVTKLKEKEGIEEWNGGDFGISLWHREGTKDFTIIVDGMELKVHKIVLSTCSPVFEAMFESNMKEAKENQMLITDFSHHIVEAAIKLCYHKNLPTPHLSTNDKMALLAFFDKYDIQHPKAYIENFLINEITSLNVCKLSNCALATNSFLLQQRCSDFLRQCLKAFVPISDFDNLDKDFALNVLKNSFHHVCKTV